MKKYLFIILISCLCFFPKDTYAQQIQNTGVTLKNSTNTSVLYSGGINNNNNAIAYTTGKVEFPFGSSVAYDNSYSFTMTYDFTIPYTSDYNSFGWGNPELYINSNGLQQQTLTISSFSNTLQSCEAITCRYRLNLAFTFGSNAAGTLYLAIPVSPPHNIYGWNYINIDLTSYGANTSNSDLINNNNQNTQNIINNQNSISNQIINNSTQNTQNINNHIDSIGEQIVDNTTLSDSDVQDYLDSLPPMGWGIISNIVTLPIYLLNVFISWFDQSCSPISLGSLYNNNITLACYDVSSKLGNVYTYIDVIFACFIYYNILMFIVGIYDSWTSFNDDFEGLYIGKHTPQGYSPRHGGGK